MNYGSEIWGSHKAPDMDRIYMRFSKYVLNVRTQTTNAAVYTVYQFDIILYMLCYII